MLIYIEISLFDSPAQTLINTVNTVGVMGKGIALQFKQLYPEMYEQYRKFCLQGSLVVGKLYVYRTLNKIIVNFPTKRHWREHSQVKFIEDGLQKFVERYADYGISSVAFPQLGCGNGELDWDSQVRPVMEKYLKNLPIPVYIHIYKPQPNFVPERLDMNYAFEAQHNIRLVRQQPSADQFWLDLQESLTKPSGAIESSVKSSEIDVFKMQVEITEDSLTFNPYSKNPPVLYREDVQELWNALRLRGTLRKEDVPIHIGEERVVGWLFKLLTGLDYIKPIQLRSIDENIAVQGLVYTPLASANSKNGLDIAV